MLGRQWLLSLQSTQMDVEVQAHPLPPPGQIQQLWENNRTRSTQTVVEVQAHHRSPPGQTKTQLQTDKLLKLKLKCMFNKYKHLTKTTVVQG